MDDEGCSYRPARDGSTRWLMRIQALLAVMWLAQAALRLGREDSIGPAILYLVLGTGAALYVVVLLLSGVKVADDGISWRVYRATAITWEAMEEVVLHGPRSAWRSEVGIDVRTMDGQLKRVPSEALAGLQESGLADRRNALLDCISQRAERAGVTVTNSRPGDPIVP